MFKKHKLIVTVDYKNDLTEVMKQIENIRKKYPYYKITVEVRD